MTVVQYDGSFEGFLAAVFEVYEYKFGDVQIVRDTVPNGSLFGAVHVCSGDAAKASRVFKKLGEKLSKQGLKQVYDTYLSELPGIENVLLRYIQYAMDSHVPIENDYTNKDVLMVQQTSRKVHREKHRMEAFVRFQLTRDQLYYCLIQPDYNVLPLISKHFTNRYADQRWLIYDSFRKYGLYYDGDKVAPVEMNLSADLNNNDIIKELNDENEALYQQLWKQYFSSVNIVARKNMKLHIQHMPKRYWRYLIEKQ